MNSEALFWVTYLALWVVVVVQTLVLLEVLQQVHALAQRVGPEPGALLSADGLQRGVVAPQIGARDLFSGQVFETLPQGDRASLLVFLSPRCDACRSLATELPAFSRAAEREAAVFVVCSGAGGECAELARAAGIESRYLLDEDQSVSRRYHALRTPTAVLVGVDGLVRLHATPNERRHLEYLLREEATPLGSRAWLRKGVEGMAPTRLAAEQPSKGAER